MSLLARTPVEPPAAATRAERWGAAEPAQAVRSGRPGQWTAVAAALAVLGAAYALLPAAVRLDDGVRVRMPVQAGLAVPEFGDRGTDFLAYEYGRTVTLTVPLDNAGPLPVTVEEVRLVEPDYPLLEPVRAGGDLEIGPFASGSADLTFEYANCRYYHERAAQTFDEVVVTGSVLGRAFTETVRLDRPLAVHAQVILDCPERTLVRGDDVRLPAPGRG